MKMFVANCTRQPHDFCYRVPEEKGARMQRIEDGGQIQLSGDLNTQQIESIAAQHAVYGMIKVDEVNRTKPFFGLCYSVDKPVSINALRAGIEHNQEVLVERGEDLRKSAAVAISGELDRSVDGSSPVKSIKDVKVTIEEEKTGTGDEHEPLNESIVIDKTAPRDKSKK